MDVKQEIQLAWRTNNTHNLRLLKAITVEGLACSLSQRGGRNIAGQFVHIHHVRLQWMEVCNKSLLIEQHKIDPKSQPDRKILEARLSESAAGVEQIMIDGLEAGKIKGYKGSPLMMLSYFIAHESHHRGNILLTLKQCNQKIDDKTKWGLWEW